VTLTRRELMRRAAVAAAGATVVGPAGLLRQASAAPATLGELAVRSGRYFGTAASVPTLLTQPSYRALIAEQCSVITPENEFKWSTLQPVPGQFNWTLADTAVSLAEQDGLRVRGNCFTWANGNPWWFDVPQFYNPGNALRVLEEHITAVVNRYKGRVYSWDVVNECTNGAGYYPTPWAKSLGPRYIDNAFTIAHRADPNAQLVMNEYHLEYTNRYSLDRQRVLIKVLDDVLSRDIPVHAVGIQAHLEHNAIAYQFDPAQHRRFLRTLASMGLKIIITELDMIDLNLPTDHATRDRGVAYAYQRYLDTVLSEPAVEGVSTWGLSDNNSWMNQGGEGPRFERADGEKQRPLPYGPDLKPKPARDAVAGALQRARRR
jgi:endo-1,4-beta-xylanase